MQKSQKHKFKPYKKARGFVKMLSSKVWIPSVDSLKSISTYKSSTLSTGRDGRKYILKSRASGVKSPKENKKQSVVCVPISYGAQTISDIGFNSDVSTSKISGVGAGQPSATQNANEENIQSSRLNPYKRSLEWYSQQNGQSHANSHNSGVYAQTARASNHTQPTQGSPLNSQRLSIKENDCQSEQQEYKNIGNVQQHGLQQSQTNKQLKQLNLVYRVDGGNVEHNSKRFGNQSTNEQQGGLSLYQQLKKQTRDCETASNSCRDNQSSHYTQSSQDSAPSQLNSAVNNENAEFITKYTYHTDLTSRTCEDDTQLTQSLYTSSVESIPIRVRYKLENGEQNSTINTIDKLRQEFNLHDKQCNGIINSQDSYKDSYFLNYTTNIMAACTINDLKSEIKQDKSDLSGKYGTNQLNNQVQAGDIDKDTSYESNSSCVVRSETVTHRLEASISNLQSIADGSGSTGESAKRTFLIGDHCRMSQSQQNTEIDPNISGECQKQLEYDSDDSINQSHCQAGCATNKLSTIASTGSMSSYNPEDEQDGNDQDIQQNVNLNLLSAQIGGNLDLAQTYQIVNPQQEHQSCSIASFQSLQNSVEQTIQQINSQNLSLNLLNETKPGKSCSSNRSESSDSTNGQLTGSVTSEGNSFINIECQYKRDVDSLEDVDILSSDMQGAETGNHQQFIHSQQNVKEDDLKANSRDQSQNAAQIIDINQQKLCLSLSTFSSVSSQSESTQNCSQRSAMSGNYTQFNYQQFDQFKDQGGWNPLKDLLSSSSLNTAQQHAIDVKQDGLVTRESDITSGADGHNTIVEQQDLKQLNQTEKHKNKEAVEVKYKYSNCLNSQNSQTSYESQWSMAHHDIQVCQPVHSKAYGPCQYPQQTELEQHQNQNLRNKSICDKDQHQTVTQTGGSADNSGNGTSGCSWYDVDYTQRTDQRGRPKSRSIRPASFGNIYMVQESQAEDMSDIVHQFKTKSAEIQAELMWNQFLYDQLQKSTDFEPQNMKKCAKCGLQIQYSSYYQPDFVQMGSETSPGKTCIYCDDGQRIFSPEQQNIDETVIVQSVSQNSQVNLKRVQNQLIINASCQAMKSCDQNGEQLLQHYAQNRINQDTLLNMEIKVSLQKIHLQNF